MSIQYLINYCKELPPDMTDQGCDEPFANVIKDAEKEYEKLKNSGLADCYTEADKKSLDKDSADLLAELLDAYDKYIKLLCAEIDGLVSWASGRGWASSKFESGMGYREKINKVKEKLGSK